MFAQVTVRPLDGVCCTGDANLVESEDCAYPLHTEQFSNFAPPSDFSVENFSISGRWDESRYETAGILSGFPDILRMRKLYVQV